MSHDAPSHQPASAAGPPTSGLDGGIGTRADDRRGELPERRAVDRKVRAIVEGMSDAFITLDAAWRVTYANHEAARLNSTTAASLLGRSHWEVWPQTVGSEIERQYRRVASERVAVQFEHYYPEDGIWHQVRAYPGADGGVAVFFRDITAQKHLEDERERQARELADAHERAIAAETQFRLLVDRVRDYGVFLLDPDGIITHWGQGAERIKGYRKDEIVGKHLRVLYPPGDLAEDGSAEDHLRHAIEHGEYIGEGTRIRKNGELFPARVVLTALRRGGKLIGLSKITQDLTGERERERAMQTALVAAQEASGAKSQFLANTSHEIRTPLNAIMGYADLLELGLAGPLGDAQRQYVGRIQSTSRHLLALVNDVLDLSKIEAGQMRAARDAAELHEAVAAALQFVEPQARARSLRLAAACAPRTMYCGDAGRVQQILVNLLSNAVRFTEPGGRITVTCGIAERVPDAATVDDPGHQGGWAFVRVEDTGVGIAPDQLERIWEAFVQAGNGDGSSAYVRRFGGSGLGLTISRHLARLMGGDIVARSEPGLGSSFALWLPAAPASSDVRVTTPTALPAVGETAAVGEQLPETALHELAGSDGEQGDGMQELADALLTEVERVITTYAARLRTDPGIPNARGLGDAQVEDHGVTFVADLAQCLAVIGRDGEEAEAMLRDGSEIQRLIAVRHGEQRARLGWVEGEVRREYQVLREEVQAALLRGVVGRRVPEAERATGVLNHFFARAEEASLEAFRSESGRRVGR